MSELDKQWYKLEFAVARSLRYHSKRRAFFERCNQVSRAVVVVSGAGSAFAAFAYDSMLRNEQQANVHAHSLSWFLCLSIVVATAAGLDLIFEFSRRAMTYDHLYRCFADLSVDIARADKSEQSFRELYVRRLLLEKDEPTPLDVLNVVCSNEELQARGFAKGRKIHWWQNAFKQFFSLPPFDFTAEVVLTPD